MSQCTADNLKHPSDCLRPQAKKARSGSRSEEFQKRSVEIFAKNMLKHHPDSEEAKVALVGSLFAF